MLCTATEKQMHEGTESRDIRVNSEKPVRHLRGGAMWASACTGLKFRGEVKGEVDIWGRPHIDGS